MEQSQPVYEVSQDVEGKTPDHYWYDAHCSFILEVKHRIVDVHRALRATIGPTRRWEYQIAACMRTLRKKPQTELRLKVMCS